MQVSPYFTLEPTCKSLSASQMQSLFRRTLSSADIHNVTQYIQDAQASVQAYRLAISKHKIAITALEEEKQELLASMEKCRTLLSPVHKMPPEILTNIFKECCSGYQGEITLDSDTVPMAFTLSSVCWSWRGIALGTPRLWTRLSINLNHRYSTKLYRVMKMALENSRSHPLWIEIDTRMIKKVQVADFPIIQLLVEHCERWEHLRIYGLQPNHLSRSSSFTTIRGRLPILKSLHLSSSDANDDLFSDSPALESVELVLNDEMELPVVPWQQMKTLHAHQSVITGPNLGFIELCRDLESLKLTLDVSEMVPHPTTIQMTSVTDLTVSVGQYASYSYICDTFTFPNLSTICFDSDHYRQIVDNDEPWAQRTIDLICRSSCSLTTFHLGCRAIVVSDEEIISILSLAPALKTLYLSEYEDGCSSKPIITRAFLNHLTLRSHRHVSPSGVSDPPFLPRLTDLTLVVHHERLEDVTLEYAVLSRCAPYVSGHEIDRLKSVTIEVGGGLKFGCKSLGASEAFTCLKDMGVHIEVKVC